MFQKIEDATISELAQIGIGAETYDKKERSKSVLTRKRKRNEISPPTENRPRVKREKIQDTEMSSHIVKILNQKLSENVNKCFSFFFCFLFFCRAFVAIMIDPKFY